MAINRVEKELEMEESKLNILITEACGYSHLNGNVIFFLKKNVKWNTTRDTCAKSYT